MNENFSRSLIGAAGGLIAFALVSFIIKMTNLPPFAALLAVVMGILIFFAIFQVLATISDSQEITLRLQQLKTVAPILAPMPKKEEKKVRSFDRLTQLANLCKRLLFMGDGKLTEIRLLLVRAGLYREDAVVYYLILKLILPASTLIVMGLYSTKNFSSLSTILLYTIGGAMGMSVLIDRQLRKKGEKRREKISDDLPDVLDLIVIYAETGTTFDTAIIKVTEGISRTSPELAAEFAILSTETALMPTRNEAYANLLERVPLQTLKNMVIIIRQSEAVGSPIANSLKTLSAEMRRERLLFAERKAARIPVMITIPLILFILPALLLIVLGPAAINIYNLIIKPHLS